MSLHYLTDRALAVLRRNVDTNENLYKQTATFLTEDVLGPGWSREAGLDDVILPELTGTRPQDDLLMTQLLFPALRKLTPVQAADERLWAYLTHVTYWNYMKERWGAKNIHGRYFFKSRGLSGLALNGLSRLWWFGKLTWDPAREDPWELTRILLSFQDIQQALMQRTLGRSEAVRVTALRFFAKNRSRLEALGNASDTIADIVLDLNAAGGVMLLDAAPPEEIDRVMEGSLELCESHLSDSVTT